MGLYYLVAVGLVVILLGLLFLYLYLRTTDVYRFSKARGIQLIEYIKWIFCRKGYELVSTRYVAPRQVEAILTKNSISTMVQIRQNKKMVSETQVEFLYSMALKDDCDWAIIICPRGFTKGARLLARKLGITLYGYKWLRDVLRGCRLKFDNREPS